MGNFHCNVIDVVGPLEVFSSRYSPTNLIDLLFSLSLALSSLERFRNIFSLNCDRFLLLNIMNIVFSG